MSFRQLIGSHGDWSRSGFSDLPEVGTNEDPILQRWCVVAGGLALILSRTGPAQRSAHFNATLQLYQVLRESLRHRHPVPASATLLCDVMHEVASLVDPAAKACLKACFRASLGQPSSGAEPAASLAPDSSRASQPRSAPGPSSLVIEPDGVPTDSSRSALQQRSDTLRRTLATARTTSFAELK